MVREIFSNLAYPFSYFAGIGFTADHLYPRVTEATKVLEYLEFKACAFTADGASPNRNFFKMVAEDVHETFFGHITHLTKQGKFTSYQMSPIC